MAQTKRKGAVPSTAATPPARSRRAAAPAASRRPRSRRRRPREAAPPAAARPAADAGTARHAARRRGRRPPVRAHAGRDLPAGRRDRQAIGLCVFAMLIYIPLGYAIDRWVYNRRCARRPTSADGRPTASPSGRCRRTASSRRATARRAALVVDPGEEAERLIEGLDDLGLSVEAILITHTHFDHVGAVAPLARHTGAPVYCPELEKQRARRHHELRPVARASARSSPTTRTSSSAAARSCELAGFEIDVLFTPGHSPGPRHLLDPGRAGDVLRRRPVPGLDRPHRPPGRRHADADAHARRPGRARCRTRRSCTPATWGSPRSAGSGRRTRSCASSRSASKTRRIGNSQEPGERATSLAQGGRTDEAPTGLRSSQRTLAGRPGPHPCAPPHSGSYPALRPFRPKA